MPRPKPDKASLLADLSAHVLAHGLNTASLRPLAAAAGTSDRMLIYHFGSKDGLIADLLTHLAQDLAAGLDAALPAKTFKSERELVGHVVGLMRSKQFQPYCRVWMDIVSSAAQGGVAHRETGGKIIDMFLQWIALRHPEGETGSTWALTLIEGILIMDAVGRSDLADAAVAAVGRSS